MNPKIRSQVLILRLKFLFKMNLLIDLFGITINHRGLLIMIKKSGRMGVCCVKGFGTLSDVSISPYIAL